MILSIGTIVAPDRNISPGFVIVEHGRVVRVGAGEPPSGRADNVLRFPDGTLIPGMIDLQVNGGAGVDCSRCVPEEYDVLGRYLAGTGVTAYLPTIISAPLEDMRRSAETAVAAMGRRGGLPEILGVHLEGPYLNPLRRGAHQAQDLRHPSVPEILETLRRLRGAVRVVTLAPELEGAQPVVRALAAQGVVPAVGHTDADYDEVRAAAQWGARLVTHVFNAMRGLHHREPGAAGGALLTRSLVLSVIADGIHVHPAVVGLIARVAGTGRVALITDAISGAGMERGSFTLGGRPVEVRDGVPRLPDGTLAGSVLRMNRAVRNFADAAEVGLREAVQSATLVPARLLGLARKGQIVEGCDADLVVLDREGAVFLTLVAGQVVYARHGV
ncbi:MAG TPA: N-acetylglucosamine-6-phosphate deacetylase [bacterium]|nr:N-acetylglucosamine-6-phosphate deacetylase [bacterium]